MSVFRQGSYFSMSIVRRGGKGRGRVVTAQMPGIVAWEGGVRMKTNYESQNPFSAKNEVQKIGYLFP